MPHLLQEPLPAWITKERQVLLKMIQERYKPDATFAWIYQWYLLTWQTEVSSTGRFLSEETCTNNLLRYLAQSTSQPTSTSQVIIQPHVTETNIGLAVGNRNIGQSGRQVVFNETVEIASSPLSPPLSKTPVGEHTYTCGTKWFLIDKVCSSGNAI